MRREKRDFLDGFTPNARAVLNALLDKYTDHGLNQLDDLHVLELAPFSDRGTVVEIAGWFGGTDGLRTAVANLQTLLYAA